MADFAIRHYWSHLEDDEDKYRLWFSDVVARTASLIAQWQTVGFAHGVMNTDNMSLLGLTLDYGPFGFLDDYEPGFICNHRIIKGVIALIINLLSRCGIYSVWRRHCHHLLP